LLSKGKNTTMKDFMLEILIHPSPNTEAHYTQHSLFSPFPHQIEKNKICHVGSSRWRVTMFFELQNPLSS
jgi:hypothetical protein